MFARTYDFSDPSTRVVLEYIDGAQIDNNVVGMPWGYGAWEAPQTYGAMGLQYGFHGLLGHIFCMTGIAFSASDVLAAWNGGHFADMSKHPRASEFMNSATAFWLNPNKVTSLTVANGIVDARDSNLNNASGDGFQNSDLVSDVP